MKTVLIFNPPLYFSHGKPHSLDVSLPPLGPLYLASYINHNSSNFRAKVVDIGRQNLSLDQIVKLISRQKPLAIGITSMTPQLQATVELAQVIKKNFSKTPIFLGGPHISADPEFITRHSQLFDYAITGEAEITFLKSLNQLLKKKKVPLIQASFIPKNLDKLPLDKKLINRSAYRQTESLLFSRGCPFHCYYCSRPSISRLVRYRSVASLIAEIKHTQKYHRGQLSFQDDTFTQARQPVVNLCQMIITQKLKLSWDCNTRIDLVDQPLLQMMSQAGCRQINFGIESGNEKIRQTIIQKGNFSNRDIQKVFFWCHQVKIKVACYFMIGHPTETKKNLSDTKKMILTYPIDVLGLSIPIPFPGSALFSIAQKQGIISPTIIDQFAAKKLGEGYAGVFPLYVPPNIKPSYLFHFLKELNRQFYFRPHQIWQKIKQDLHSPSTLFSDCFEAATLLFKGMSSRKPYSYKTS